MPFCWATLILLDSVDLEPFCRYCAGAGFRQAVPYAHRTGSGRWSRKGWSYCCWSKALEEKLPMQEHDSVLKTPSVWILSRYCFPAQNLEISGSRKVA